MTQEQIRRTVSPDAPLPSADSRRHNYFLKPINAPHNSVSSHHFALTASHFMAGSLSTHWQQSIRLQQEVSRAFHFEVDSTKS